MKREVKWRIGFVLLGMFIGWAMFGGAKECPKCPVCQTCPKVECAKTECPKVENADCSKENKRLDLCIKQLELSAEGNEIAGEIIGNYNYYIYNQDAMEKVLKRINEINTEMARNNEQIK
jgi:hypothetical protein